jgi:predicted NUDIX family NTP pyrophosphohydrolase
MAQRTTRREDSAGVLLWRRREGRLQVLLAHPGGPYWRHREEGAWTMPKGLVEAGESLTEAALRELHEEVGAKPEGPLASLGSITPRGRKTVHAWAARGDFDCEKLHSNSFTMEWPPRSGCEQRYPEVDRAAWLTPAEARRKILKSQIVFLDRLEELLRDERDGHASAEG